MVERPTSELRAPATCHSTGRSADENQLAVLTGRAQRELVLIVDDRLDLQTDCLTNKLFRDVDYSLLA